MKPVYLRQAFVVPKGTRDSRGRFIKAGARYEVIPGTKGARK